MSNSELLPSNSIQFSGYKGYIKLKKQNQCILCMGTMKICNQHVGISCRFLFLTKKKSSYSDVKATLGICFSSHSQVVFSPM